MSVSVLSQNTYSNIPITEDFRIVTVVVTGETVEDSPVLAELYVRALHGSGHMLGDSVYCSK